MCSKNLRLRRWKFSTYRRYHRCAQASYSISFASWCKKNALAMIASFMAQVIFRDQFRVAWDPVCHQDAFATMFVSPFEGMMCYEHAPKHTHVPNQSQSKMSLIHTKCVSKGGNSAWQTKINHACMYIQLYIYYVYIHFISFTPRWSVQSPWASRGLLPRSWSLQLVLQSCAMYVCVYMRIIHKCVYIYICVCVCIIYIYIYIYTCVYMCVKYIPMCIISRMLQVISWY